jgi:hypothetical protein
VLFRSVAGKVSVRAATQAPVLTVS